MKIAAAQTIPKDGDIIANLADHYRLTQQAADEGAELIIFPEMSLTGYVMEQAASLAFVPEDERLQQLQSASAERNIIIVAGAPLLLDAGLHIGAFILHPDGNSYLYTKQFLHTGEEVYFIRGNACDPLINYAGNTISMAICADITNPVHPRSAADKGTTLYLAGIFYTPGGIAEAYGQLSSYAQQYKMHVLMANYGGPSHNLPSAGRSAVWNNKGKLIAQLDIAGEELLITTI